MAVLNALSFRRMISTFVLCGVALAGTLVVTAAPAAAATNYNNVCEGGEVCLFSDKNYLGAMWDSYSVSMNFSDHHYVGDPLTLNDTVSSAWCAQVIWDCGIFEHSWTLGREVRLDPGTGSWDMWLPYHDNLNNLTSSWIY
jgi:peptidase inhibitor family I36